DTSKASPLPRDLVALSIEFCYIIDYLGEVGSPNDLSYNLLNNIEEILGAPPVIRIGGDTGDAAQYNPHNNQTITNVFKPNNLEAVNVTFNSGLFQVMNENVPENQTCIFTLNLGQDNVQYPLEEVKGVEAHLNESKLYAYELGNEPDIYEYTGHRTEPWNVQTYAQQQVDWLSQIKREINNTSHGFQLGALAVDPVDQGNFSLAEINSLGVPEIVGNVKSESDHTYPYSNCPEANTPSISLHALMSHLHTLEYFSQWTPSIAAATSINASFVMGETGSVSCHGAPNISNTLGAALWEMDYVLHAATLGMRRVHFHNGSPFWYSMWQPVEVNGTAPRVWPT
ncbi:glycoside hydrolase family 79 protein, partial [Viridothelium virens]